MQLWFSPRRARKPALAANNKHNSTKRIKGDRKKPCATWVPRATSYCPSPTQLHYLQRYRPPRCRAGGLPPSVLGGVVVTTYVNDVVLCLERSLLREL